MEGLLEVIPKYGLKVEEVFKEVRKKVIEKTNNKQIPWESSSLVGDFYFTSLPIIAKTYSPEFKLPSNVKGSTLNGVNAYLKTKNLNINFKKDQYIELEYELIDNNVLTKMSPMFVSVVQRRTPTIVDYVWSEQFEINPGKNIIRFSADFSIGEYELVYRFYFKDNLNVEFPSFYSKRCPLKIIE